jgi:hypothetical protein
MASDGAVAAAHYGKHAYVQWSVDEGSGACLFERTNGGTRPTAIGLEFLEIARRILGEMTDGCLVSEPLGEGSGC